MNTDIATFIRASMPDFSRDKFERFSKHGIRSQIVTSVIHSSSSVDLSRVVGTEHPDYWNRSWIELLGNPPGGDTALLKRIHGCLADLERDPSYYVRSENKDYWSFYLVSGRYYVTEGMHRTVVARFFFACNQLPQVVSGVKVIELILRKGNTQNRPKYSLLYRLFK